MRGVPVGMSTGQRKDFGGSRSWEVPHRVSVQLIEITYSISQMGVFVPNKERSEETVEGPESNSLTDSELGIGRREDTDVR